MGTKEEDVGTGRCRGLKPYKSNDIIISCLEVFGLSSGASKVRPIKAIRTDCVTGEQKEVELAYEVIETDDGRKLFKLQGGPTGYESFHITQALIEEYRHAPQTCGDWIACSGTKGIYDKLVVPLAEMREALGIETEQKIALEQNKDKLRHILILDQDGYARIVFTKLVTTPEDYLSLKNKHREFLSRGETAWIVKGFKDLGGKQGEQNK